MSRKGSKIYLSILCSVLAVTFMTGCQGRYVFLSDPIDSHLGGGVYADAWCQTSAETAGLPGTYKAWLAFSSPLISPSPSTTFTRAAADEPYVMPGGGGGMLVALGWDGPHGLTSGNLYQPINENASGQVVADQNYWKVWSAVAPDGTPEGQDIPYYAANDCNNWLGPLPTDPPHTVIGLIGSALRTDWAWTLAGVLNSDGSIEPIFETCDTDFEGVPQKFPLYCFQQDTHPFP